MNKLVVPDTGEQLAEGSVVILARFPGTKWVVHCGWYTYQGQQYSGWYFSSIPSQTILPVSEDDLRLLTVVSSGDGSYCPYPPYPYPPGPPPGPCPPPPPPGVRFTEEDAEQLSRAWLSVETITDRDAIPEEDRLNGKIVRVDETPEGTSAYYRWDAAKNSWVDEDFGLGKDELVTQDELTETISQTLQSDEFGVAVGTAIESNDYAKSAVTEIIETSVPDMISRETAPIKETIIEVQESIKNVSDEVVYIKDTVPEWNDLG